MDEKIAEWQALADKASPGPFVVMDHAGTRRIYREDYEQDGAVAVFPWDADTKEPPASIAADAAFFLAAREAVPELLALVTRLRAELAGERERAAMVADAVYDENEESMYGAGWAAASAKIAAAIRRG